MKIAERITREKNSLGDEGTRHTVYTTLEDTDGKHVRHLWDAFYSFRIVRILGVRIMRWEKFIPSHEARKANMHMYHYQDLYCDQCVPQANKQ